MVIPVSPWICLVNGSPSGFATEKVVGDLNRLAVSNSIEYFFGNDLAQCPGNPLCGEGSVDLSKPIRQQ
jgi:hypothetical protein